MLGLGFAALSGAVAPPRIELNLEGMTNAYKLNTPIYRSHDLNYVSRGNQNIKSRQDWTEKCTADQTCEGRDCNKYSGSPAWVQTGPNVCHFPQAQGYDHKDTHVSVTTRVFLVDTDSNADPTPNNAILTIQGQNHNENGLVTFFADKWNQRSTYLFKYDAQDTAGNHAEQVVFALILDDTEAPFFDGTCADYTGSESSQFNEAITVEAVSTWTLCNLQALDNVDGNVTNTIRYDITYLGRDTGFDNTNDGIGFHKAEVAYNASDLDYDAARMFFTPRDSSRCNADDADATSALYKVSDGVANYDNRACGPEHVGKYLVTATVRDHARVYGHNAMNNTRSMEQAILVRDSVSPTIYLAGSSPSFVECRRNDAQGRPTDNGSGFDYEAWVGSESDCKDRLDTVALGRYLPVTTTIKTFGQYNVVDHSSNVVKPLINAQTNAFPAWPNNDDFAHMLYTTKNSNTVAIADQLKQAYTAGSKTYVLQYDCMDYSSNEAAQVERTITTQDTHAPTLTLLATDGSEISGDTDVQIYRVDDAKVAHHEVNGHDATVGNYGSIYARDSCDAGVVDSSVSTSWGPRAFNAKQLGDYVRTYSVTDVHSNVATKTRTFTVIDESNPVIDMVQGGSSNGFAVNTFEASRDSEYTDHGATCQDYVDGELSHAVEVSGEVVNMRIPGTYQIRYDCQDLTGNSANPAFRNVVITDSTPPVVTLKGPNTNYVESGFPYVDAGATATDTLDGDITQYIWTDGNTVATQKRTYSQKSCGGIKYVLGNNVMLTPGEYFITRQVNSVMKRVKVHCYFSHDVTTGTDMFKGTWKWHNAGDPSCESWGMTKYTGSNSNTPCDTDWYKNCDKIGNINEYFCHINGDSQNANNEDTTGTDVAQYNAAVQGTYIINFNVEDKAGNANTPAPKRTVIVKDTLPPVITLKLRNKLLHVSKRNHIGLGGNGDNEPSHAKFHFGDMKNPAGYYVGSNAAGNPDIYETFGNPHLSEHKSSYFNVNAANHDVYRSASGGNVPHAYMAESTPVNGWIIAAAASAVAGVALLGMSQRKSAATSVPV